VLKDKTFQLTDHNIGFQKIQPFFIHLGSSVVKFAWKFFAIKTEFDLFSFRALWDFTDWIWPTARAFFPNKLRASTTINSTDTDFHKNTLPNH